MTYDFVCIKFPKLFHVLFVNIFALETPHKITALNFRLENTKCNGNNEESFKLVVFNIKSTFGYNLNTGRFAEFEFGFGFDDI